jgi:hypothetical protein
MALAWHKLCCTSQRVKGSRDGTPVSLVLVRQRKEEQNWLQGQRGCKSAYLEQPSPEKASFPRGTCIAEVGNGRLSSRLTPRLLFWEMDLAAHVGPNKSISIQLTKSFLLSTVIE